FNIKLGHQRLRTERLSDLKKENIEVLSLCEATAGEIEKAQNVALHKIELGLDILRLYDFRRDIGVQREFFTASVPEDIYHQNLKTRTIGSSHRAPPPARFFPYILDRPRLDIMRKTSDFLELCEILQGTPGKILSKKIIMSLYWYGLAVKEKKAVDRYVKLIVALESLLLGKKDKLKKQLLAERVAFILGKNKEQRKEMFELVDHMYTVRSDIIHEGKHDVSDKEALDLLFFVRILIFTMVGISKRLHSLEAIDERILEIKFGSQIRGV
ncbi:HEPN domain-containing protein, partial [Candidatus Bathyarchaeota archaeon]|nr:HEPN domain-containing protein [Candidatus Bathyarchaeota archaeon]